MQIEKRFTFEAAHRLLHPLKSEAENKALYGKCYNLHGHSYKLFIKVSGEINSDGMIVDFGILKKYIQNTLIERWDHTYLNELPELTGIITTVENLILVAQKILLKEWPWPQITLENITLWETENSYAHWQK